MTDLNDQIRSSEHLVETDWLERHLNAPELRIFDCTVHAEINQSPDQELVRKMPFTFESGRKYFNLNHIPGAGFIDILEDLSDKTATLPMMMPPEEQFIAAMSQYGINNDSRVILYSTTEPNWATRVWWMLRSFGFNNAAILNGGWAKWSKEGRAISNVGCTYPPGNFKVVSRPGGFVGQAAVLSAVNDPNTCLINALPAMIHKGSDGPIFGRKGHISGSVNVPYSSMHDPDTGRYLTKEQLQEKFNAVNVSNAKQIIAYCGGGIASSNTAFALTQLGFSNVTVYDASMLEWGNNNSLPMETG